MEQLTIDDLKMLEAMLNNATVRVGDGALQALELLGKLQRMRAELEHELEQKNKDAKK